MSNCANLTAEAPLGVAPALRAVDCLANDMTASAFGRLFGSEGALLPALTMVLTLYIAFFAVALLTGRSRIGISALTPRMITLGMVLTLSTSWVAYQSVVWNLAIGAPDQVAAAIMGAGGSATTIFADRMDMIFAAIVEAAQANNTGNAAANPAAAGTFTPTGLMWLGAVLLLLGTVGILVTARIALAVLLAVGPLFIVFALFTGSRGLTAGWLRGVVMTAVTPLFVVTAGGMMIEILVPIIAALRGMEGIEPSSALALFMVASVHVALMAMVLKVAGAMVGSWRVFGLAADNNGTSNRNPAATTIISQSPLIPAGTAYAPMLSSPAASTARSVAVMIDNNHASLPASAAATGSSRSPVAQPGDAGTTARALPAQRARGIGSRFHPRPTQSREMMR